MDAPISVFLFLFVEDCNPVLQVFALPGRPVHPRRHGCASNSVVSLLPFSSLHSPCAQVLALDDAFIPADMDAPRRGAVPVRFFGTYNFCWIESQRSLAAYAGEPGDERAAKSKLPVRACLLLSPCVHGLWLYTLHGVHVCKFGGLHKDVGRRQDALSMCSFRHGYAKQVFQEAIAEADRFLATGVPPAGFDLAVQLPEDPGAAGQVCTLLLQ